MHSRLSVERFNLQAGIVGKAVHLVVICNVLCLLQCVLLQRVVILGNFLVTADVVERQHLECRAKDLSDFVELMLVVGGKYYFFHHSVSVVIFFVFAFTLMVSKPSP